LTPNPIAAAIGAAIAARRIGDRVPGRPATQSPATATMNSQTLAVEKSAMASAMES
jgi:hypothetical protein